MLGSGQSACRPEHRRRSRAAKTTVYLDPEDYRRLKAMARERDSSAAELNREAIAEYTRRHSSWLMPRSLGMARSGRPDLGECAEELLSGMGRDV